MNVHGYLLFPPLSASWGQGEPAGWWEQQGEKEKEGKQKEQEERRPRQETGRVEKGRKREREDRQAPGGHPPAPPVVGIHACSGGSARGPVVE